MAVGALTTVVDNSGNNWAGVQVDYWVCGDTAGTKERFRVVAVAPGGDATKITISANATEAANKTWKVGGAWSTDLALTFITTAFVNAAGDKPRLLIKSNSSITLAANRTTSAFSPTQICEIEGYNATIGDLKAESYATAHSANGYLTKTGYPTIACAGYGITFGIGASISCLAITGSRNAVIVSLGNSGLAQRLSVINSNAGSSTSSVVMANRSKLFDCDISLNGSSTSVALTTGLQSTVEACRITAVAGSGATVSASTTFINCLFHDIASGKFALTGTPANSNWTVTGCTFANCDTGINITDVAATDFVMSVTNCRFTGCTTYAIRNAGAASRTFSITGGHNYYRDNGVNISGFFETALPGDITTDSDDATEYVSVAGDNYRLNAAAQGRQLGCPAYLDIGCFQRVEDYPTVGNVHTDDTTDGATGTLTLPTVGQVESGVQYGAGGTEFTGTLAAGGGILVHPGYSGMRG